MSEIADEVGTPVYVYSTATLVRHARIMREALAELDDPLIAYAVKANPNPAVLATLARAGMGGDIVSIGEYRRARAAGMPPERILFSGVGKTADEMAEALAGGLLQFNLESVEEARMLSQVALAAGTRAPVAFRINPDVEAGTHAKITTGTADNKFGIPAAEALDAFRAARDLPGLEVTGVTVHIGSQLTSLAPLEAAFERLGELIGTLRDAGFDLDDGRSRRRAWRALRPRPARAAEPRRLWRDGGAGDARLGRAAGVRARAADQRQCRGAAVARGAGQAGRGASVADRRRGDERPDAPGALRCLSRHRRGRAATASG